MSIIQELPALENNGEKVMVHYDIQRLTSLDTVHYKHLRMLALAEKPPAFGTTTEEEQMKTHEDTLSLLKEQYLLGAWSKSNHELVGMIRLRIVDASKEAELGSFYVKPEHRRQGLGKILIKAALDILKRSPHVQKCSLEVVTQQRAALNLYKSFGFQITHTEKATFQRENQTYDEYVMVLHLSGG